MNPALWFCQIRVRSNGELSYGKGNVETGEEQVSLAQ